MDKEFRIIISILLLVGLLCGCAHQPQFRQPAENIIKIDLVHSFNFQPEIIHTITDDEIISFMRALGQLECRKRSHPIGDNGTWEIWIHYLNGDVDIVGTHADRYLEQGELTINGWYYYREEDLRVLFDAYVPESSLAY